MRKRNGILEYWKDGRMEWRHAFHLSIVPFLLILICFLFIIIPSHASNPVQLLDSANKLYAKGDFVKAQEYYEKIVSLGYESPEVYYNLGNACFKTGNIAHAILNYERAKKLSPHDEDINFNLKLANQRTLDKIEPLPRLFLEEWWDNLKSMRSENTWGLRSILCFVLFFFFLAVFLTSQRTFTKQLGFWLSIVFFIFSGISFSISQSRYADSMAHNAAIIISPSAEIKNAPSESGAKLFILHEGSKVTSSDTSGAWVKVEISPDKVGWVKRGSIEFI